MLSSSQLRDRGTDNRRPESLQHVLSVAVGINLYVLTFNLAGAAQVVKYFVRDDVDEGLVLTLEPQSSVHPLPLPATICADKPLAREVVVWHFGPCTILVAVEGANTLILRGGLAKASVDPTVDAVLLNPFVSWVLAAPANLVRKALATLKGIG